VLHKRNPKKIHARQASKDGYNVIIAMGGNGTMKYSAVQAGYD
jgi:diacylglycerol kinase family enzyme